MADDLGDVNRRPAAEDAGPGGPAGQSGRAAVTVAFDGSPEAAAALRWAAHEAASCRAALEIVVAWQDPVMGGGQSAASPEDQRAHELAAGATTVASRIERRLVVRQHVECGTARSVILGRTHEAGLLVMGTAGHVGRLGALLGSVSRYVVNRVDVPVVLLGPEAASFVESRIVVVCRFGVAEGSTVAWAIQRARSRPDRVLHLLDTWSPPGLGIGMVEQSSRDLAHRQAVLAHRQALEQLRRAAGEVPVSGALFEGRPADVEYAHALPGDLLVVGAADVDQRPSLAHVRCPVAVVPPMPVAAAEPVSEVQGGVTAPASTRG